MSSLLSPCQLRLNSDRVQERDAWDLAREIVELARAECLPVMLRLDPHGCAWLAIITMPGTIEDAMDCSPLSVVGVYTGDASVEDVYDDIVAMPRGMECAP